MVGLHTEHGILQDSSFMSTNYHRHACSKELLLVWDDLASRASNILALCTLRWAEKGDLVWELMSLVGEHPTG